MFSLTYSGGGRNSAQFEPSAPYRVSISGLASSDVDVSTPSGRGGGGGNDEYQGSRGRASLKRKTKLDFKSKVQRRRKLCG